MNCVAKISLACALSVLASAARAEVAGRVCEANIRATDDIVFDPAEIKVARDCRTLKVNFRHSGTVLQHNFVLARKGDIERVRAEGEAAGDATGYLPKGKGQILAHTALLSPGGTATIEVPVASIRKSGPYGFYCSFPGHGATMKGGIRFTEK